MAELDMNSSPVDDTLWERKAGEVIKSNLPVSTF